MARTYRTASGTTINLDNLILANEETIAVGNMNVNARGDELGPGGKIAASRNANMDAYYKLNTEVPEDSVAQAAQQRKQKQQPIRTIEIKDQLTAQELEFEEQQIEDSKDLEQPRLRGTLAGSVAKQVIVPEPTINKGPKRI